MKDQVEHLQEKGIAALYIHSGMTAYEVNKTLQQAAAGHCKFLYLSPERLETTLFREYLPSLDICLLAIDEAHCISQWGYDFRSSYLRIAALREDLPGVPVLAVTASATPFVQDDIMDKLLFKQHHVIRQSFERENLSYSVFNTDSKINKAVDVLNNVEGSGIVYCRSRKQTKMVAQLLSLQNINADYYHAGLPPEERTAKQEAWMNNSTRVIVCTNAFGMGIDKPDVRAVIHYDVPDCLENYYQEAGRAGRDGQKAYAVLLHNPIDLTDLQKLPDMRFPPLQDIQMVYQAIADYLQIPIGLGEGNFYDFDFNTFIANFKLSGFLVVNVLKVLEQEGHLSFSENIFLPSQVRFIADRQVMNDIEQTNPDLDTVMKCMLRTYEGILDNRVSINEKIIARLCRLHYDLVYNALSNLQALGIIEYMPQKDTPQIYFILNRAPAKDLHINHQQYLKRKQQYIARLENMIQYVQLSADKCRSQYIANYFGCTETKPCGICDNCRKQKSKPVKENDFKEVEQRLYELIPPEGIELNKLLLQLSIKKEIAWQVIKFLQSEKLISVNQRGIVTKSTFC